MRSSDLARLLRRWADEIDGGKVELNGRSLELPQRIEVKRKFKEKEGLSKFGLKISWPAKHQIEQEEPAETAGKNLPFTVPGGFKEMKKLMENSLDEVEMALKEQGKATESLVIYMATVDYFRSRSKPEWLEGITELINQSQLLRQAIDAGKPVEAETAITGIRRLKKKYHDIFK